LNPKGEEKEKKKKKKKKKKKRDPLVFGKGSVVGPKVYKIKI
jgi:hypothetical protein